MAENNNDFKALLEGMNELLEEQKRTTRASKSIEERFADDRAEAEAEDQTRSSAAAEDDQKQATSDKKGNTFLGKMAKGISGMAKDATKATAAKLPSLKSLLLTGGLAALMYFLNSPYFKMVKGFVEKHILPVIANLWDGIVAMWGPLKKFFVETLWPMAKSLWNDYLKPIGAIWVDYIVKAWDNIKLLFGDLGDMFSLFGEGKWSEGFTKFFDDIVPRLIKMVDNMVTAIWNVIAKVLGLEATDSVFGTISDFFTSMYHDVVNWITLTKIKISQAISDTINSILDWFKLLFSDPVEAMKKLWDTLTKGYANIMDFIWSPVKSGIAWVMKLFGWDEAAAATEEFSIKDYIMKKFAAIKTWFTDLFAWTQSEEGQKSWVVTTITKIVTGVKKWLGDLFKFDSTSDIIASAFNVLYFLPNIILKGLKLVTEWLLGLFGFDEKAKKLANAKDWSIGGMITDAFKGIVEWFGGLFDIDWKGLLTSIIPSWVPDKALGWLGIGDKPGGTPAEIAAKAAADRDILKGKASDLASQIAAKDLKSSIGWTSESDLRDAKKELDEMKAQIRALDAKASVTAVDAKQIADNRKTNNVVYNQTQLRNQTSAAWAAAGSAW